MSSLQTMAELPEIAEEAVKKIDSKLECSICLDNFKEPKLLPCFHIFCKSPCLERLVVQDREGESLVCPTCRHLVRLPDNGVAGLQTDFHIDHLFEIRDSLNKVTESKKTSCEKCNKFPATGFCRDCNKFVCDRCIEIHQVWEEFAGHKIVNLNEALTDTINLLPPKKQVRVQCKKHPSMEIKLYCNTCFELICSDCTITRHHGHIYDLLSDVFSKHKEEIVSSLKPVKEKFDKVNIALKALHTRAKEIKDQRLTVEADINREIDRQQQFLDQRRVELVGGLDMLTQQNLKSITTQTQHVEVLHAKMSSCLEYAEGGLETGTEEDVLAMKAPVLQRIEQITAEFDPATIQPQTEADIELVTDGLEQVSQACRMFGEVVYDPVSVDNSYAIGNGSKYARTGKQATVEVHTMTIKNKKCEKKVNVTAELVHTTSRATIECEVKQENGRHKITYQTARRGKHNLHIRINGKDIQGSPYPIAVISSTQSLRKPITVVSGLKTSYGITTNSKRQTVVAGVMGNCISVLTPEGEKIHTFGTKGLGEGQFMYPHGVATDRDDNIYVADNTNHRIQKFTYQGSFLAAAGNLGKNRLQFCHPVGVCFNERNSNLYVCDAKNHRLQVLTTDLTFVRCFGRKGRAYGQFQTPMNAAFDDANHLYVTDCDNHRVQVFTDEGRFLRAFSNKDSGEKLQHPHAIAIDSSNTVYVSERDRHCVSVFTPQGDYINSFGTKGTEEGQFDCVYGLSVQQGDLIFVTDYNNSRLQIF